MQKFVVKGKSAQKHQVFKRIWDQYFFELNISSALSKETKTISS